VSLNPEQQRAYLQAMGIPLWQVRQPHLLQNVLPEPLVEFVESPVVLPVEPIPMVEPEPVQSWSLLQQKVSD